MKLGKWAAAIVAVAVVLGGGYLILAGRPDGPDTKTLVYCSEGNPEGFNASLFTSGTTFDASSRQIYSRLVEFEHGSTNLIPGLAESWDVGDDGLSLTFILRAGVQFHDNDRFTPTR
ncbi:MAG: ABC transporter substrate-binding protein, partial [Alphaproteobacteria bacterium]|nr:ABC transporter substrate-binding protein [Alphaproteobacteria bacterium]